MCFRVLWINFFKVVRKIFELEMIASFQQFDDVFLTICFFFTKELSFRLTYEAVLRVNFVCVITAWLCYFGRPKIDRGRRVVEGGRCVGVPAGLRRYVPYFPALFLCTSRTWASDRR